MSTRAPYRRLAKLSPRDEPHTTVAAQLAAAVSIHVSCGGDSGAMRVTLTDEGCTYEGIPVDTAAGRYAVACFVESNSDEHLRASEFPPPERANVATELEVTGTPTYP